MKLSAKLVELDKYYIQKEVDDAYRKNAKLEEKQTSLKGKGIDYINYRQITSSGMILIDVKIALRQTVTDLFKIEGESVMMEFMYNSNIEANVNNLEWQTHGDGKMHNITFSKNYCGKFKMTPDNPINFFIIILSKDYYFNLIPKEYALHREFVKNIFEQKTSSLSKTMLSFNPSLHAVINDIRQCKRTGELKKLYLENKVQELLLLQLEINQQQHLVSELSGFNQQDQQKLLEAKKLLDTNFTNAPKLAELARMTYLNEFKLKKGFKACFGTTVKRYVIELKMKYAVQLLNKEKYTVSEIAELCGYNGIVQFSAAFKTFYGHSPKSIGQRNYGHVTLDDHPSP